MSRIVFDNNLLKVMSLFTNLTGANLKDCMVDEVRATFIVGEGEISRAIGKKGANVRRIEKALNRKIKIVEFNPSITAFIRNLFYPSKIKDIQENEGVFTLIPEDLTARGFLIGKNASNLRACEEIVKRYFEVKELRVK